MVWLQGLDRHAVADGTARLRQETAALRDFSAFDVRFESKAAETIGVTQRPMSALPPKADKAADPSRCPPSATSGAKADIS
jgi:hypothetical protein